MSVLYTFIAVLTNWCCTVEINTTTTIPGCLFYLFGIIIIFVCWTDSDSDSEIVYLTFICQVTVHHTNKCIQYRHNGKLNTFLEKR